MNPSTVQDFEASRRETEFEEEGIIHGVGGNGRQGFISSAVFCISLYFPPDAVEFSTKRRRFLVLATALDLDRTWLLSLIQAEIERTKYTGNAYFQLKTIPSYAGGRGGDLLSRVPYGETHVGTALTGFFFPFPPTRVM